MLPGQVVRSMSVVATEARRRLLRRGLSREVFRPQQRPAWTSRSSSFFISDLASCRVAELPGAHRACTTVSAAAARVSADRGKPQLEVDVPDFQNAQLAFEPKSTFELLRTWLIFRTCAIGFIVRNCDFLYQWSTKLLGSTITHGVLRRTFFNHFCAGETASQIVPRMDELRKFGVGGILDYAAEAKEGDGVTQTVKAADEASTVGAPLSSRGYAYHGEAVCDANAEIFLEAVRGVRDATPDGFAAIKLSGLGDPVLLERMSTCLVEMARLFKKLSDNSQSAEELRRIPYHCMDRSFELDFNTFSEGWQKLFTVASDEDLRRTFETLDLNKDGRIGYLEWSSSVKLSEINELVRSCKDHGPLYQAALDEAEVQLYRNMCDRVLRIMDLAQELGVRVMVDAEWTDIQPAIDHIVIFLQRRYNGGDRPIVFNTYQTYLKGMHGRVLRDLERSKQEGWRFGAKVVRGAYMVSEREKAQKRGQESPVCETYEDTEANYHRAIDSMLEHNVATSGGPSPEADCGPGRSAAAEILIASHNRGSIEHVLRRMEELKTDKSLVGFGQLLGMADHLTFTLGTLGYKAYKYVPYGPIDEVMPYLIRRTQENSAILGSPGVQEERRMVTGELRRRLSPL